MVSNGNKRFDDTRRRHDGYGMKRARVLGQRNILLKRVFFIRKQRTTQPMRTFTKTHFDIAF